MVRPVVLGIGKPLFEDGATITSLKLIDSKTTDTGVVMLTYEPAN
jgi:hypothetical protein